jgi:hypothetical protein
MLFQTPPETPEIIFLSFQNFLVASAENCPRPHSLILLPNFDIFTTVLPSLILNYPTIVADTVHTVRVQSPNLSSKLNYGKYIQYLYEQRNTSIIKTLIKTNVI